MPLLLTPYTLGSFLPITAATAGGGAFYTHRRRWLQTVLVLCLCVGLASC